MAGLALITGASSGIGEALARIHAERGGDAVLVARSTGKLRALAEQLGARHGVSVSVTPCDLAAPEAAEALARDLLERGVVPDFLINNAGVGAHGRFHETDWPRLRDMIEVNAIAVAALTRAFLPPMIERGSGRVMNVASMAGFLPGPLQAVYYATKAFVLSLSEALAEELGGSGVTVTALCPGATDTGFKKAANLEGAALFKTGVASARSVAEAGYAAMEDGRAVIIPGAMNKTTIASLRLLPRAAVRRVSRLTMEKK